MRARIDITEVETATKIRAKYLRALENEEWDLLPGPIYIKSFLRTYGDYLGLDSRMLTDEFAHRYERPSDHDLHSISSLARERERRNRPSSRVPPWVPIVAVVLIVVGILYYVGSASHNNPTPAAHNTTNTTTHHATHHPAPVVHHPTAPKHRKVTVQLAPTGLVYVCLVNGGGRKLINAQNFNVGQTIPTETARHLLLTLGNNAVQVKVDGRKVPVAASASAIRLFITPVGVTHIPLSQKPTCP